MTFFLALEQKDNDTKFRDNSNINHYRYLPQEATFSNPDGLPVGMTKDQYKGKDYMGFTCAACHTSQLNYKGVGIRIDGAPSAADMETFMIDLAEAMRVTLNASNDGKYQAKQKRFITAVLALDNYDSKQDILADLKIFSQRIKTYTIVNRPGNSLRENGHAKHPMTHYGYARLDAFGRIFNRVLEHVMSADQLRELLKKELKSKDLKILMDKVNQVIASDDRDHIIEKLQEHMTPKQQLILRNAIYNPPDAPVSYPFLWDIPQHDYVQWNGMVANAGVGPIGRNAGQVIGVFGILDWHEEQGNSLSTILGGQNLSGPHYNFESSINIRNLQRVEHVLRKLHSPQWEDENLQGILPPIEHKRAAKGEAIFDQYCLSCHANIDRTDPKRRVVAQMTSVASVNTDPKMANNSVSFTGYSGILKNLYVDMEQGKLLLEKQAPVAALLTMATRNVITTPDPDKWMIRSWLERLHDFAITFLDNEVQVSLKRGQYEPNTTSNPFASLVAYKARPLNGIWATAPYLHNGSVPTLYDLLLPKKRVGDPENAEYRPDEFMVGSREFDPINVGFKSKGYPEKVGFKYRTSILGNHNTGHEYAAGYTKQPNGKTLPSLSKTQRLDLLEYLKTL